MSTWLVMVPSSNWTLLPHKKQFATYSPLMPFPPKVGGVMSTPKVWLFDLWAILSKVAIPKFASDVFGGIGLGGELVTL